MRTVTKEDVNLLHSLPYSKCTISAYAPAWRKLIGAEMSQQGIQKVIFSDLLTEKKNTRQVRLAAIRVAIKTWASLGLCPMFDVVFPHAKGRPVARQAVSDEQLQRMIDATVDDKERLFIVALADTGARVGTICKSPIAEMCKPMFVARSKGDKEVRIWTSARLRALAGKAEYKFVLGWDTPTPYKVAYNAFLKIRDRAGVSGITMHSFRHRFITKVADAAGVHVASIVAGHASIQTTMGYIHVKEGDIERIIEELG